MVPYGILKVVFGGLIFKIVSQVEIADTQRIPEGGTPGWTVLDLGWVSS